MSRLPGRLSCSRAVDPRCWPLPLLLGLAHGAADAAAGLLLGDLPRTVPLVQVGLLVLLYNAIAFAGQPFAGLIVDRWGRPRTALLGGLTLLGTAVLSAPRQPTVALMLAGVGSALFHVGGGALTLGATPG